MFITRARNEPATHSRPPAVHRPSPARTTRPLVGYGHSFEADNLIVACPRCKAPEGEQCDYRAGRSRVHVGRQDRARRLIHRATSKMGSRRENVALRLDPDGPLWRWTSTGHQCGTPGPHVVVAECTTASYGPWND